MRILFLILFIALLGLTAKSQVVESAKNDSIIYKNSVSWSPALIFFRGFKMSYAMRIFKTGELEFSPVFYYHSTAIDYHNSGIYYDAFVNSYDEMLGVGLETLYKSYLFKTDDGSDIYAATGLEFDYFKYEYQQYEWGFETVDGLDYYRFGLQNIEENIYVGSLKMLVGIKGEIVKSMFYDFSFGLGMRYSIKESTLGTPRKFNTLYFGKGYSGTMPIFSVKVGKNF